LDPSSHLPRTFLTASNPLVFPPPMQPVTFFCPYSFNSVAAYVSPLNRMELPFLLLVLQPLDFSRMGKDEPSAHYLFFTFELGAIFCQHSFFPLSTSQCKYFSFAPQHIAYRAPTIFEQCKWIFHPVFPVFTPMSVSPRLLLFCEVYPLPAAHVVSFLFLRRRKEGKFLLRATHSWASVCPPFFYPTLSFLPPERHQALLFIIKTGIRSSQVTLILFPGRFL